MRRVDQDTPDGAAYFGPKPEFEYVEEKMICCLFPLRANWNVLYYKI